MGLVHSGWRGTAKDILGKTLRLTKDLFGKKALEYINVQIAPFAKGCCYEFSKDTFMEAFFSGIVPEINKTKSIIEPFSSRYSNINCLEYLLPCGDGFNLDHEGLLRAVLKANGVNENNINISPMCTICEGHDYGYYSSRKDPSKRFGVLIFNRGS